MTRLCSVEGCGRAHQAKGLCKMHWQRQRRTGRVGPAHPIEQAPTEERFWRQIRVVDSGCWEWTGITNPRGYGRFRLSRATTDVFVHRWSYEHFVGPIPDGLQIDHLCFNRVCANPAHLEPVTGAENVRRYYATVTTCKRGHDLTDPANYRITGHGARDCRQCGRERRRARAAMVERDELGHSFDPVDPRHGSEYAYSGLGCRCGRCRSAASAAAMARTRRLREREDDARISRERQDEAAAAGMPKGIAS